MAVTLHPSPETLAAFGRGDLSAADLASVAEHIGTCAECCAALARLPDDTLAKLARDAAEKGPGSTMPASGAAPRPGAALSDAIPAALADHPRYKILRELGAGGMGVVYKAEHRIMGRVVALKVMAPHLTAKAGAVDRFRKEVRAAAQLNHENIVTAHDADEAGGMHFLVMEYVEGVSLDRLVTKKGPVSVPLACSFVRQAAQGLQHAHDKGMVHRDIKPQNLMVNRKAKVKVMDFGLARFVGAEEEEPAGRLPFGAGRPVADPLTNPNLLMGTPDYLSPEQARNSHKVDARSDVYSLGCTLFFLLTGKPPFAHAPSLIDKLLAHTEEGPPAIRELRPDVPEGVAAVLERMLEKNPDDRFETAADVASILHPFTRSSGGDEAKVAGFEVIDAVVIAPPSASGATPAPLPRGTPAAAETGPVPDGPTLAEAPRPRRKKSRKRQPWWKRPPVLLGAAAVLLAAVAVGLIAGKKKDEGPPKGDDLAGVTPERPEPAAPPKPNPFRPGDPKPVLYVVPSDGVYGPDYFPVVERLQGKVAVKTASGRGGAARVDPPHPPGIADKIPVDLKLAAADAADYSIVVFCGREVKEYLPGGEAGTVTRRLLGAMRQQDKPVAAICVGQRVLIEHGLLDGKKAAYSPHLIDTFGKFEGHRIGWDEKAGVVTTDTRVITAGGPADARAFGNLLAEAATKTSK
jgi:serine/threonine-protein kinase